MPPPEPSLFKGFPKYQNTAVSGPRMSITKRTQIRQPRRPRNRQTRTLRVRGELRNAPDVQALAAALIELAQDSALIPADAGTTSGDQAFFERLYISDEGSVRSDLAEPFALLLGDELATEAQRALGDVATQPPDGEPTTTPKAHTSHGEGLNKTHLVDLSGQLSNTQPALEALAPIVHRHGMA